MIFWIFWSGQIKGKWNVRNHIWLSIITIQAETSELPNESPYNNASSTRCDDDGKLVIVILDCSPPLSWSILRIGLLMHPSIIWEYRARTWSSHRSFILAYLVCYALFESIAHKHLVDSCFMEKHWLSQGCIRVWKYAMQDQIIGYIIDILGCGMVTELFT